MFSSAQPSMTFGRPPQFAQAYRKIAAETGITDASPHRLVAMLYDGVVESVAEARGAMRSRDHERKGKAIGRAVRIVEEGLRGGLNVKAGGRLAEDLNQLYGYVVVRLTQANLRNDETILDECLGLVQPLREAWMSIGNSTDRHAA
jgi:flagellar secretion chaperone FliS